MENNFLNYLENEISEKNISHAFLIETNNMKQLQFDISRLLYKNNIIDNPNADNSLSLKIVYADNNLIDKNKILDIQKFIMTKSINHLYKVYFINNAELMNLSSFNKLLKILEEPSENVIGFLLTNNINSIIPTIKSRCKHFKLYYDEEEPTNLHLDLINKITNIKNVNFIELLNIKNDLLSIEKNELIELLNKYKKQLLSTTQSNDMFIELANIYKIVDNSIDLLKSNVNPELVLDKLFIELRK